MEALFHLRDYGYEHLTELTLDGLLIRLTETTWVRKGAILSPFDRMEALHSLVPPGLVLSHDSAWWVHRGLGRVPTPLSFITLPRRRWIADDDFSRPRDRLSPTTSGSRIGSDCRSPREETNSLRSAPPPLPPS
jgi:hypothetical protein